MRNVFQYHLQQIPPIRKKQLSNHNMSIKLGLLLKGIGDNNLPWRPVSVHSPIYRVCLFLEFAEHSVKISYFGGPSNLAVSDYSVGYYICRCLQVFGLKIN